MATRFGSVAANPVNAGQRFMGRILQGLIISAGYLLYMVYAAVSLSSGSVPPSFIYALVLLYTLGMTIWQIVLVFKESCMLGGKILKYKFIRTDTGEDAKSTAFVKYLVQNLFEGATFGIGTISLLVSYREGQHWLDRAFNVVGVQTQSVASVAMMPATAARPSTPGPRVMPVQMPQRPVGGGSPTPAAPQPVQGFGPGPTAATPMRPTPGPAQTSAPRSPVDAPVAGQSPFAPPNPWALPADSPREAPRSPEPVTAVGAPSFAPPGQTPLRPVAPSVPEFPKAPVPAPVAAAAVPRHVSPSLLSDETVIDPEVAGEGAPVIVLDDGMEVQLDAPVVLGRNPTAPEAYPGARTIQVIDESMRLSKTHFVAVPVDGRVAVYDVGATNGIHLEVDGQKARLEAGALHTLPEGAVVHFGGRSMRVAQ